MTRLRAALPYALGFLLAAGGLAAASVPSSPVPDEAPRTSVWVFAHPDDETLAAGGAIARAVAAGERVVIVIVSDGTRAAIGGHLGLTEQQVGASRRAETRAAAAAAGVSEVVFGGLPDGEVRPAQVRALVSRVRTWAGGHAAFRGHSPWDEYPDGGECGHRDHCAVGAALVAAYREGEIDDLVLYRMGHLYGAALGGVSCTPLAPDEHAVKASMADAYTMQLAAAGRLGLGGRSAPTPFAHVEAGAPECIDVPLLLRPLPARAALLSEPRALQ